MEERFVQVVGGCSWKIFTKKNWDGKSAELSGFLPKTHVTSFNFKHGSVRSVSLSEAHPWNALINPPPSKRAY
jgi:hypothetical protein